MCYQTNTSLLRDIMIKTPDCVLDSFFVVVLSV